MADLLIKGLEMPKGDLALWITVHKDGTVEYNDNNKFEGYKTLLNAAVTVPPHGRLIDADAFAGKYIAALPDGIEDLLDKRRASELISHIQALLLDIAEEPIVIPASEEVENGQV